MDDDHYHFMREAIGLAAQNLQLLEGGPFGALVVKDGKIVGRGYNKVASSNDPTAHAEIVAIRDACKNMGTFQLDGCVIYSSCEPCPMCLGAIFWARPEKLYFAAGREDAADAGFDDSYIYQQLPLEMDKRDLPTEILLAEEAVQLFEAWKKLKIKPDY